MKNQLLALATAVLALGVTGCTNSSDHPTDEATLAITTVSDCQAFTDLDLASLLGPEAGDWSYGTTDTADTCTVKSPEGVLQLNSTTLDRDTNFGNLGTFAQDSTHVRDVEAKRWTDASIREVKGNGGAVLTYYAATENRHALACSFAGSSVEEVEAQVEAVGEVCGAALDAVS